MTTGNVGMAGDKSSKKATSDNVASLDVGAFRAESRSILQAYETLLLERNSMIYDLEMAKSSYLREESRHSLLEKENAHLKQELNSNVALINEKISGIIGHFNAQDKLNGTKAELLRLNELVLLKTKDNEILGDDVEKMKSELSRIKEKHANEAARFNQEIGYLKDAMRKEEEKWKSQLEEATQTCRHLEKQLNKEANNSLELMWKQKVLTLRNEVRNLEQENLSLKQRVESLENFKVKKNPKSTQKRRKTNNLI